MQYLLTVVGITIVSIFLQSPFLLQTQYAYEGEVYGQGYDVEEMVDSDEATGQEEETMEEPEEDEDNSDSESEE